MADKEDLIKSAQENITVENQEQQDLTDTEQNNSELILVCHLNLER